MGSDQSARVERRATWNEVLWHELEMLRPRPKAHAERPSPPTDNSDKVRAEDPVYLRALYKSIAAEKEPLSALCLSGGGIRSATFNLGVLQRLGFIGLLGKFDYLSSVSGGGYIAGWLKAWMSRAGTQAVLQQLARPDPDAVGPDPLDPEPRPILKLREYSNYLTPRVGFFSGDTWSAASIISRNLLLNWLVILPLLAAVIGIPQVFLLVARTEGSSSPALIWGALLVELIASFLVYGFRRFAKRPHTPQALYILTGAAPICLAVGMLALTGLDPDLHSNVSDSTLWTFALAWCVAVPFLGWAVVEVVARNRIAASSTPHHPGPEKRQPSIFWELVALASSGAVAAVLLVLVTREWLPFLYLHPVLYVILAPSILLGIYLLSRVLFVGIVSRSEDHVLSFILTTRSSSDELDREWWARLSGWLLLVLVAYVVVTAICLLGSHLPDHVGTWLAKKFGDPSAATTFDAVVKGIIGVIGGIAGAVAAFCGNDSGSPASEDRKPKGDEKIPAWILPVAAPLFVVCVIVVLAWMTEFLGAWFVGEPGLFSASADMNRLGHEPVSWITIWSFVLLLGLLVTIGLVASRIVNVNRFSLHGMYRNRLVRAYLGASNESKDANRTRKPDPFTGFAIDDNVYLGDLWREDKCTKPMPLINTTLNLVNGANLAWQQRKAESFCMTPFYCGNYREGYRRTSQYTGKPGISLGTAMTISGAAANPNMGYSSSPALGFLMALFNLRLGAWLGNTNECGDKVCHRAGPKSAILPLFAEVFGLTNSSRSYVNLSDGGHFDNLGLYEVVLRRCRHVVVSDAGCDGGFAFEDLGNAIRKVRIDFGIPIEFVNKIEIRPTKDSEEGLYCATARIRYSAIDGKDVTDGWLVYVKPTLRGRVGSKNDDDEASIMPYDVYSYAQSSGSFPHESTADQWFSESQFESYRELGWHALTQLTVGLKDATFENLVAAIARYSSGAKSASIAVPASFTAPVTIRIVPTTGATEPAAGSGAA